jgi:hypothetical protein
MRSFAAALIVLSLAGHAAAQQPEAPAPAGPAVDVDRLPIDLRRVQRELQQSQTVVEERDGLNLRYTIQIYGSSPRLLIFDEDANLVGGPVPYGAPTHREIIDHITPREYRAPVADFSALLRWLADRGKKGSQ